MKDGIGRGRTIGKLARSWWRGGKKRERERSHAIDDSL